MLSRILEPEVMDTPQEAEDYDQMDHRQVNALFVTDLLATGEIGPDVLDVGTGTAQIPIELCQRHEEVRVMAVDAAVSMLEIARLNIEIHSVRQRVSLAKVDAKAMPFDDAMFHTVISNSIIHHIPSPREVLAESVRVTTPGGLLFFRDLLRPADDATVKQLVQTYAGEANAHQQKMFDDSLRAALSLDEIRALVESLGFAADTVQQTSDRHWTWAARKE